MKKNYPVILFAFIFSFLFSIKGYSTNVTGGIFSNTTWTTAGSPYILSDTVVIFQGVTLTINPGVVVKFNDSAFIENRGALYADGTPGDSIYFTSNSNTPYAGIYPGIVIQNGSTNSFKYCKFYYANTAINAQFISGLFPISHCVFISNVTGINGYNVVDTCAFIHDTLGIEGNAPFNTSVRGCEFICNNTGVLGPQGVILNCSFSYNSYGVYGGGGPQSSIKNCIFEYNSIWGLETENDTIANCTIMYNGIGIYGGENILISNDISNNSIGIKTEGDVTYSCNSICNNTYNLETDNPDNINASGNYWCSTDSASIQATIYDGHQDLNLGLVFFTPFETSACANTGSTITNVNPVITVNTPSPICNGGSTALKASGGTYYIWSPATALSATTGDSVIASPTVTTTYTVTAGGAGCYGSTSVDVVVTVSANPTITATPNPSAYCRGESSTITASGGNTYTWSPASGLSSTAGATVIANPTITSTYTVTGINSSGCSATKTVTVTVNPNPTITASPSPSSFCVGASSTLTASGGNTYTWSPSTGLSVTTGSMITANPTVTTTYTVTGTAPGGCSAQNTITVTVNPLPTITVTPATATYCVGASSILTASGSNTYIWSPSTGLSATTGSGVTANPIVTTTYTVTGTNSNGCTAQKTVTVTVNPNPVISVTPSPASYCIGDSSVLTASGAQTYTWLPSTNLSATTGAAITANPTVTTTYTVTGTNSNGCVATNTVMVTVNPNPTITTSPNPAPYCSGGSAALTASGGETYTWLPTTDLSSTTGNIVTANPTITTTYTVTGVNSYGCSQLKNITVTVNPNPAIITLASPYSYCPGLSSTLTASAGNAYTWTPSTGLSATTGDTVTTTVTTTTTYTLTGTDSNSCINTATVTVTVGSSAIVTATALPVSYCANSNATLTASGALTYTWSPSTDLSATTGATVIASPTVTTTYTIDGSSGAGCTGTTTLTVTVNPNPTITVSPDSANYCPGGSAAFTASGTNTYTWLPSAGLSATTGDIVTANPVIPTTYIVTGTATNGCSATDTVTVNIYSAPGKPTITQNGDTLISSATQGNQWVRNDSVLTGATNQTYLITIAGYYQVIAENPANGCSTTSDSVDVTPTGINQLSVISTQLSIYPNPTGGEIFITISSSAEDVKDWSLQVTDVLGRTLYTKSALNYNNTIDLSDLPGGVYFITVMSKTSRATVPIVRE